MTQPSQLDLDRQLDVMMEMEERTVVPSQINVEKDGFDNNCDTILGMHPKWDCCYDPAKPIGPGSATGCNDGNGGKDCCSSSNQCGEGEGDCDSDAECFGNLKCGEGNGFDNNCDTALGM